MLIYNIKQQGNLPSGVYTASEYDIGYPASYIQMIFKANGSWSFYRSTGTGTVPVNGTWDTLSPSTTRPYEIRIYGTPSMQTNISNLLIDGYIVYSTTPNSISPYFTDSIPFDTGFMPLVDDFGVVLRGGNVGSPGIGEINSFADFNVQIRDATSGPGGAEITVTSAVITLDLTVSRSF